MKLESFIYRCTELLKLYNSSGYVLVFPYSWMLLPTEILHLNVEEWLKGKNPTNINVLSERQEVNAKTVAAQLPGISLSLRTT